MKVQGRLMKAHFIEIHQVFAKGKKKSDTFLTEWYTGGLAFIDTNLSVVLKL